MVVADFDPIRVLADGLREEGLTLDEGELRTLGLDGALARMAQLASEAGLLPSGLGASYLRQGLAVHEAARNATRAYVPPPYSGRLTLLRAGTVDSSAPQLARRSATLGWSDLVTGLVRAIEVPGKHDQLVSAPFVESVATAIRERLAETPEDAEENDPAEGARELRKDWAVLKGRE
jgi:thioesterase domain-containing protein